MLQIGHLKFYTLAFWLFLIVYEVVVLLSVVSAVEVVPDFCEPCVLDDDTGVTPWLGWLPCSGFVFSLFCID